MHEGYDPRYRILRYQVYLEYRNVNQTPSSTVHCNSATFLSTVGFEAFKPMQLLISKYGAPIIKLTLLILS